MGTMDRRALLASSLALVGLVGVGALALPLPDAASGRRVLSDDEARTCAALAEAYFPPGNPLGVAASDTDLVGRLDAHCAEVYEPEVVLAFRWALRAVNAAVLARGGDLAAMPLEARRAVVAAWSENDLLPRRLLQDLLRMALGIAFFNTPEARAAVGARPACGDPA